MNQFSADAENYRFGGAKSREERIELSTENDGDRTNFQRMLRFSADAENRGFVCANSLVTSPSCPFGHGDRQIPANGTR
jgi:hypothetical protein